MNQISSIQPNADGKPVKKIIQKKVTTAKKTVVQDNSSKGQFNMNKALSHGDQSMLALPSSFSQDMSMSDHEGGDTDIESSLDASMKEKTPTFKQKVVGSRFKAGKFNLLNYKQIPTSILVEMYKLDKAPLYRVGDKVCFKSEDMDIGTLKPVVSDYKIGSLTVIDHDKVSLILLASRSEVNGATNDHGGDIQVYYLYNFAEFHIALECIEEPRMQAIKDEIVQFRASKQAKLETGQPSEEPNTRLMHSHPNTIPLSLDGDEPVRANLNPIPNPQEISTKTFDDMADRRIGNRVPLSLTHIQLTSLLVG